MEERFVPDIELKARAKYKKAVLTAVDGKMRWIVTEEDGTQYAMRPESAKPKD